MQSLRKHQFLKSSEPKTVYFYKKKEGIYRRVDGEE